MPASPLPVSCGLAAPQPWYVCGTGPGVAAGGGDLCFGPPLLPPLLRTPTPFPPLFPPPFPVAKLSPGGGEAGAAQRLGSAPRGSGRFGTRRKAGRRGGWGLFKCKTQFVGRKSEKVRSPWRCWSVFALQQPEPAWKNPPGERNCLQPPRRAANN